MAIGREFLTWTGAPLERVAQWLVERYRSGKWADLGQAVVVVPGGRAGRMLRQAILEEARRRQLGCFPPLITTVGQLPELLYEAQRPMASPLVQQLAWVAAMQQLTTGELEVFVQPPPADQPLRWLDLGRLLAEQHAELAAEGMGFADVLARAGPGSDFQEHARWELLADLQRRYWRVLEELQLWDRQTARLVALEQGECRLQCDLILVGTVDLSQTLRRMIDAVGSRAVALVLAPGGHTDRFDEYGCLLPAAWQEAPITLGPDQWQVVDGPGEQAAAVAEWMAGWQGAYRADQISVGVPDPSLVPWIQAALRAAQVSGRYGPGRRLAETRLGRLLDALADYCEQDDFRSLAALARHVDIHRWLARQGVPARWELELDRYHADRLPAYRLTPRSAQLPHYPALQGAIERLEGLMRPLQGRPRPLHEWAEALSGWVAEIYRGQTAPRQETTVRALEQLGAALAELAAIPDRLAPATTAAGALRLVLRQLGSTSIPPAADPGSVELLGWLELPLDAAPAIIVTSMNEGVVPQAVNGDLFLPDRLRRQLGIEDNRRRYARDAYALQMVLHGRSAVKLVSARRDDQGNPLWMSRLLAACEPQETARRCLRFWGEEIEGPRPASRTATSKAQGHLCVPRPARLETLPMKLRVTDFGAYLRCPYRFYLERILRLCAVDDDQLELDGRSFGNLAHQVLSLFGQSDDKDCTSADHLQKVLRDILDQVVHDQFDDRLLAAACVQIEQLAERLQWFAVQQARWRNDGWRIEYVEGEGDGLCTQWEVDGQPVQLSGRIDRIDVHEVDGTWFLWDYKTADSGASPDKTHRKRGQWVDLQLPLYRHLYRPPDPEAPIGLGYITLAKKADALPFQEATWTSDELAEADAQAEEVVRSIRQQRFWPPHRDSLQLDDALAAIYQAGVLDRRRWPDAEPPA